MFSPKKRLLTYLRRLSAYPVPKQAIPHALGIDKMGLKMYDIMIEFCCEIPSFRRCGYGFSKR
jgi:hypothetical protein